MENNIACSIIYFLLFLLTALLFYISKKQIWKDIQKAKLPPGSMGWPYIGETLQLYSQDPNVFFANKQKRYGNIFKTHILGYPCVMLASPEAARFVLVTNAHLFKPTYPKSKEKLIGHSALFFHQGNYHSQLRKLTQSSLSPEALRKIVHDIEALVISSLESWSQNNQVINTFRLLKKAEQRAIYESNEEGNKPLTWAQTRNMSLTYRVILESLRMSSIISFTFREAVVDVEYDGYLIRKGWKVMPLFRNIHHNPEFFADPRNFDASRFKVAPKPNTYMPFGNGAHACPGNELAKLEMLILIHHLVTKFRWEVVASRGAVQYSPFPIPENGLPSRFWKETRSLTDP